MSVAKNTPDNNWPNYDSGLEMFPKANRLFGVVTWGCSGSTWLAKTLNSHPEIFCVHELNAKIQCIAQPDRRMNGVEYVNLLSILGAGSSVSGDVHGISREEIASIQEIHPNFTAAVLVREPMARLKSQLSFFEEYQKTKMWNISYLEETIKELPLPDQSYSSRLFVHGVNLLNAIVEETAIGKVFTLEKMTNDAAELGKLIHHISQNLISSPEEWLSETVMSQRINRHRTSDDNYEWQQWQIAVIKEVVKDEAWESYSELGYEYPRILQN